MPIARIYNTGNLAGFNSRMEQHLRTKRDYERQLREAQMNLEDLQRRKELLQKCHALFLRLTQTTQGAFKEQVERPQTLALRSVFRRPFKFRLQFDEARNNATCSPVLRERGVEYIPRMDMGGGVLDFLSITLRFVMWALRVPRTRKTFILDEPLKFIGKGALLQKAGNMLKELSRTMGLQLIIITHESELAEIADKAYELTYDGKYTNVKAIKQCDEVSRDTTRRVLRRRHAPNTRT